MGVNVQRWNEQANSTVIADLSDSPTRLLKSLTQRKKYEHGCSDETDCRSVAAFQGQDGWRLLFARSLDLSSRSNGRSRHAGRARQRNSDSGKHSLSRVSISARVRVFPHDCAVPSRLGGSLLWPLSAGEQERFVTRCVHLAPRM